MKYRFSNMPPTPQGWKLNPILTIGSVFCVAYSFMLVATRPLDAIPSIAYLPVFFFVIGCLVATNISFVVGIVLCALLGTIGQASIDPMESGVQFLDRDQIFTFSSFNLGFVRLGLVNSAFVLSGYFVAKNSLTNLGNSIRIYWFPILLVAFSALQFLVHFQYIGISLTTRATVIFLFLMLGVGHLAVSPDRLLGLLKFVLLLMGVFSVYSYLILLGSSSGRGGFVASMIAIPLALYFFRRKTPWSVIFAVSLVGGTVVTFIFSTFWSKTMVLVSVLSLFILLPIIQRHKTLFLVLPIANVALPFSALFVEYDYTAASVRESTLTQRERTSIADLTEFSPREIFDVFVSKYTSERNILWRSSIAYSFSPISRETFLPEPSGHFFFQDGPYRGELWVNGPHNGLLWLLRVYGLIAGGAMFFFINYQLYRNVVVQWPRDSVMHQVVQPFLLTFAAVGFAIGDYPLNTAGGFLAFVLLGFAIYLNRLGPVALRELKI